MALLHFRSAKKRKSKSDLIRSVKRSRLRLEECTNYQTLLILLCTLTARTPLTIIPFRLPLLIQSSTETSHLVLSWTKSMPNPKKTLSLLVDITVSMRVFKNALKVCVNGQILYLSSVLSNWQSLKTKIIKNLASLKCSVCMRNLGWKLAVLILDREKISGVRGDLVSPN